MDRIFQEKIGDYNIIHRGQVIVFRNETVKISFTEDNANPLILEIRFENDSEGKTDIKNDISGDTMTFRMMNFNSPNGVIGIFEPFEVAKSDDGSIIYFNCFVKTYNDKDGNRLLTYSFLTRE